MRQASTLAVVGPSGRRLGSHVVETNARALIEVLHGIPRNRHMCLEEGTLSEWLHEVLEPHVEELVVAGVHHSRGPKSDKRDAFALAEQLRIGSLETKVYKGWGKFRKLGCAARGHGLVVVDVVRVKNRLKSVLRSRGVGYGAGKSVYAKRDRARWLEALPEATRPLAEVLYEEHDALMGLRARAEKALLAEARKHREWQLLKTCPGLGPIRAAELLPVVVTPYRFRSRSHFWAYCGLGIVMRSSSDWIRTPSGEWAKTAVQRTRGLNRDFNHTLKRIFKGAATTVIGRAEDDPVYHHYERLLDRGTKPNLTKLTLARQIAALALGVWRSVRPGTTGSDGVGRAWISEHGIGRSACERGLDDGEANRLQGRASIVTVGWASWSESPTLGYAPLESRTKRWADVESLIEGWFPPPSGERSGCDRLPGCDAEPEMRTYHPALSERSGISKNADAGGQDLCGLRVGSVRLDSQLHRSGNKPCQRQAAPPGARERHSPMSKRPLAPVSAIEAA